MRHRRSRRFRHNQNGRSFQSRRNDGAKPILGHTSFVSNRMRNNFKTPQNAERLIEKYNNLAKEALSSGDKILSENYYQHADHFSRIVNGKNLVKNQNNSQTNEEINNSKETTLENKEANQDQAPLEKKE